MNRSELTRFVKDSALSLGFSKIGIAKAETITEEASRLRTWLARGYQADMHWMEQSVEKRENPRLVLDGLKSVVSVALNYYSPAVHSSAPGTGKISRYAWGDDYHLILPDRLESLLARIRERVPGVNAKVYVDTGPVMEKVWAVRAGVGWLGKHTNVITREYGSWVFLAEILLDVELEYDSPIGDFCGSCRACIDACPTDAIVAPYVLDASKCISYLTIEHRGRLPDELTPSFGRWVFGCDICQDVCPWNRFQQETAELSFHPRPGNAAPDLTGLTQMSPEQFADRFRRSPVKRAKREGLARNARAALESQASLPSS